MLRRTRSVLIRRKHPDDACFTTYLVKHGVSVQKDQEIRIADVNAQLKRTMQILLISFQPNVSFWVAKTKDAVEKLWLTLGIWSRWAANFRVARNPK